LDVEIKGDHEFEATFILHALIAKPEVVVPPVTISQEEAPKPVPTKTLIGVGLLSLGAAPATIGALLLRYDGDYLGGGIFLGAGAALMAEGFNLSPSVTTWHSNAFSPVNQGWQPIVATISIPLLLLLLGYAVRHREWLEPNKVIGAIAVVALIPATFGAYIFPAIDPAFGGGLPRPILSTNDARVLTTPGGLHFGCGGSTPVGCTGIYLAYMSSSVAYLAVEEGQAPCASHQDFTV
jgi:hypothetical protein